MTILSIYDWHILLRLADQCTFGHDKNRVKADGTSAGQNLYWSGSSEQNSFDEVINERVDSRCGLYVTSLENSLNLFKSHFVLVDANCDGWRHGMVHGGGGPRLQLQ